MGRPEKDGRCRMHPAHKDSNGVCPYCLRDRLTNFSSSSSSSTNNAASSTASSAYYSSYDSEVFSLDASPPHEELNAKNILKLFNSSRMEMLRKSNSVALYKEEEPREKEEEKKKRSKRGRFWTKLMMGGGEIGKKKEAGLSHSKTMKEKSSSKWMFYS